VEKGKRTPGKFNEENRNSGSNGRAWIIQERGQLCPRVPAASALSCGQGCPRSISCGFAAFGASHFSKGMRRPADRRYSSPLHAHAIEERAGTDGIGVCTLQSLGIIAHREVFSPLLHELGSPRDMQNFASGEAKFRHPFFKSQTPFHDPPSGVKRVGFCMAYLYRTV
jgi:hypothetical protein